MKAKPNKEKTYVELSDGTVWPYPSDKACEVGWKAIHANDELKGSELKYLASLARAYFDLVMSTQQRRNEVTGSIKKTMLEKSKNK